MFTATQALTGSRSIPAQVRDQLALCYQEQRDDSNENWWKNLTLDLLFPSFFGCKKKAELTFFSFFFFNIA